MSDVTLDGVFSQASSTRRLAGTFAALVVGGAALVALALRSGVKSSHSPLMLAVTLLPMAAAVVVVFAIDSVSRSARSRAQHRVAGDIRARFGFDVPERLIPLDAGVPATLPLSDGRTVVAVFPDVRSAVAVSGPIPAAG